MSTPSFKDIAAEAAVEVEAKQETPETQPIATEEPKEEPQAEVFAEKGDLAGKTPEQLEQTYAEWQKAYTAKRQKETQELKEYQAKLAELEQKLAMQSKTDKPIEERAADAREQVELGQMTVQQYTDYMQTLMAEQARKVAREEYKALMTEEHEQQLASKAMEQFQATDSRLNEHAPEYDKEFCDEVRRELAELLDKHLSETGSYKGFDAQALTKQLVERRDAALDESIKKRTLQSTQAAKMREAKAKKSEVRGTTSDGQAIGGDSIRSILSEAVDSAA